jgi:putative transposase
MIRTYVISHTLQLDEFFRTYLKTLNAMLTEIWDHIQWQAVPMWGKNQHRILPTLPDYSFKKSMRTNYLKGWTYAKHWVDSALKTAFAIIKSWKKNYIKGTRKRHKPVVSRQFVRVKQTLMKLEGEQLRITIKPREFVYIDLAKRYFKLNGKLGEPILTKEKLYLPMNSSDLEAESNSDQTPRNIGWDFNLYSIDGFAPETGWIKIDTKQLQTIHIASFERRRRLQKKASKSKTVTAILKKHKSRERNRGKNAAYTIANTIISIGKRNGFEDLTKEGMYTRYKIWNRKIARTDWRKIARIACYKAENILVDPYHTSKKCSRCGWINKDLKGDIFECRKCGLRIDRQLNAAINIYLKMGGLPHAIRWFDAHVLGRFTSTGVKRKDSNELVRSLYDLMRPQFSVSPLMIT